MYSYTVNVSEMSREGDFFDSEYEVICLKKS